MHKVRALVSDEPSVSVVIGTNCFNEYFDRALASIEGQTFTDLEILIVANGLSDQDFESLTKRALDSRTRIFRTAIGGVTFSRNLALHHCRAPLVAVMDADDIAYPQRLAVQVTFLRDNPDVTVCGSNYHVIDENDKVISMRSLPESDFLIRQTMCWNNPLCHPSVVFRRDVVLAAGGYCGNSTEDYELWVRLFEDDNIRFANIRLPLLGYRIPVVSVARRSRRAYAHVAGAQYRVFLLSKRPRWLVASLFSAAKVWFRATRP